jgi:hypothetical protein
MSLTLVRSDSFLHSDAHSTTGRRETFYPKSSSLPCTNISLTTVYHCVPGGTKKGLIYTSVYLSEGAFGVKEGFGNEELGSDRFRFWSHGIWKGREWDRLAYLQGIVDIE